MAKKLLNPLEDPPTASSSDDDEVETSSDEDEEQISDSSSKENKTLKTPSTATKQSSDSDSGSETDSESEAEPSPKPAVGKAIAVKSKNKESNDSPAVKSGKKRASEGTSTDVNAKKAKKVSGEDNKKAYFQRLWSEEDEISLLQGMIDYKADTGKSPYDDMNWFYEIVKKAISFDVSKVQFGDKIRGLKRKYLVKAKKGKEVSFTKAHDKKCFKLAKYIWGSDGLGLESAVKSPVKSTKKVEEDKEVLGSDGMVGIESAKSNGKSKKVESKVDEDKEMLVSDDMVAGESAKCNGKSKNVESMVEEDNEVLVHGGGSESSNWFEKSFIVRSITSLGVDEPSVKQKWSKVPMEIKKRLEEKLKLVQAKEFELLKQKTDILSEVTSVMSEAI